MYSNENKRTNIMKTKILFITSLLLIVGCSKPVEDSTLINKDGLMYLPDSDSPYSGEVFTNYDTGKKLYSGIYENGLLISYSYLNKDGSIKDPINYETTLINRGNVFYTKDTNKPYNGVVFSLYDNGKKKSEGILHNGKVNRECIYYDNNGTKTFTVNYSKNKMYGKTTYYFENGQKMIEGQYTNGKFYKDVVPYQFDDITIIKEGMEGIWKRWDENGQLFSEITYKNGKLDSKHTSYYENGQKREEGNWNYIPRL